ncbi:thiamine pyrophosphate enzyme, N-terminal TPP binding domain protein [Mycobacterium xenopi 4042]|uniref:acetolactate synthase n=1 Tax=Mycobacterium xenopi 4042 TaxID=1299334 RepID=X7ZVP3_MYCXE|nr:thiamine pyrophosphate enzyme, N-terminal TPP binding domain protein [Mycobacterium xenopi 4042]
MRGVLTLFEGVATGAADGYARIAGRPAAVLVHLGPGLANGLANLHNARRARVPMVVVVGDHATYHKKYDAPWNPTSTRWPPACRAGCAAAAVPVSSPPMPPRPSPQAKQTNIFRR